MRQIVLSSSSPARYDLMQRLQIPFVTAIPDIDESPLPNESAEKMVVRLAESKARKMANEYPDALIIGSDQVGVLDKTVLCKPLTHENAIAQLRLVSGKMVRFYNGLCLLDSQNDTVQLAMETYDVYFRILSDQMIENYLRKEEPYFCAGGFRAEGLGIALIDKFAGDDYTALIGLPLIRLNKMLEHAAVEM